MKTLLVTGGNGQIAMAMRHHRLTNRYKLITLNRTQLNITNSDSIIDALTTYQPDILINTAAYTAVDLAETEQAAAMLANHIGAKNIALACQQKKIKLIHLSTDYVFNGQHANNPYTENCLTDPMNFYGKSKLLGEQTILSHYDQSIILRVSSVCSEFGKNFLKTILTLARDRDRLRVVNDQISCPTDANDIAGTIFHLAEHFSQTGIYHYTSDTPISWHGFACAIFDEAKKLNTFALQSIEAITTHDFPQTALRPRYSVLNCNKIMQDYGLTQPAWRQAIKRILPNLLRNLP